jgi:hypothetical protein
MTYPTFVAQFANGETQFCDKAIEAITGAPTTKER